MIPRGLLDLAALEERCWSERERRLLRLSELRGDPLAMATSPQYAGTVNNGSASLSATADVSYTAPANAVVVLTAGASGSKVDEVRFQGIGTTVAGTITVFLYDGATYHLVDEVGVPAVTASATIPPWQYVKQYPNLVLKSGWSLRVASTVASQLVKVSAFGGDF